MTLPLEERGNINGRVKKKDLKLLMMFLVDETILSEKETEELVQYIMGVRDLDATEYDSILEMLREVASKN